MFQEKTVSRRSVHFKQVRKIGMSVVALALVLRGALPATAVAGQFVAHNTPLCGLGEKPGTGRSLENHRSQHLAEPAQP